MCLWAFKKIHWPCATVGERRHASKGCHSLIWKKGRRSFAHWHARNCTTCVQSTGTRTWYSFHKVCKLPLSPKHLYSRTKRAKLSFGHKTCSQLGSWPLDFPSTPQWIKVPSMKHARPQPKLPSDRRRGCWFVDCWNKWFRIDCFPQCAQ